MRATMHRAGAAVLTELLRQEPPPQSSYPCSCGQAAYYKEQRSKTVLTAVGPVQIERPYYLCSHCHQGQYPSDVALDVQGTEFSPGVRRMMALVGGESPFQVGQGQLEQLAGLKVSTKAVERTTEAIGQDIARRQQFDIDRSLQLPLPVCDGPAIAKMYVQMDGTGIPVVRAETEGRKGKMPEQAAHTREVKLGCVFTQTRVDAKGRAVRDEDSTSYTGAIENAEAFGRRIYQEAFQRGWNRARLQVVMGDGALWVWNIAEEHFPGAVQIVDLYHARQHLWDLAARLVVEDGAKRQRWVRPYLVWLEEGKIKDIVVKLRGLQPEDSELAYKTATEADYFERNAERMQYPGFRRQGLFVGSGVIEAGCKTVIGSRLKKSGMFWTVRGANAVIALRCCRFSRRFEDYWETRTAA